MGEECDLERTSNPDESKIWTYGVLAVALMLVAWIGYSALGMGASTPLSAAASAAGPNAVTLQPSSSGSVPSECGDINDPRNIQHLSHHPDRYRQCYGYIDPQKFRDAVGRDIREFTG